MKEVIKYSLGVDVDSEDLVVKLLRKESEETVKVCASRKFKNRPHGFAQLHKWLESKRKDRSAPLRITMEATGIYHEALAYFLHSQGYELSVVLPNKACSYFKSLGLKSKTDKIDAGGLALMGMQQQLECWKPFSPVIHELRSVLRYRESKQKLHTKLNNQLHALQSGQMIPPLIEAEMQADIARLDEQIDRLEVRARELVKEDEELAQKIDRIEGSIKGLGFLTLASIAAETNGFTLFTSQRQLTSYAGYDVKLNESGKRKGKTKISKQGNSHIRRALYMSALNVVRYGAGYFPAFYQRVFSRTGIKMKGYVAVQRKLLCLIYTLWKKDQAYDPQYHIKSAQEQLKGAKKQLDQMPWKHSSESSMDNPLLCNQTGGWPGKMLTWESNLEELK